MLTFFLQINILRLYTLLYNKSLRCLHASEHIKNVVKKKHTTKLRPRCSCCSFHHGNIICKDWYPHSNKLVRFFFGVYSPSQKMDVLLHPVLLDLTVRMDHRDQLTCTSHALPLHFISSPPHHLTHPPQFYPIPSSPLPDSRSDVSKIHEDDAKTSQPPEVAVSPYIEPGIVQGSQLLPPPTVVTIGAIHLIGEFTRPHAQGRHDQRVHETHL